MEILHVRYGFGRNTTLSKIVAGDLEMFALEDERRITKVPGETCIPMGRYEILLRAEGGMDERYAKSFPEMHRGMLWLQNVPDFSFVYYHIGNYENQTDGCPLVGLVPQIYPDGEFSVGRSRDAYVPFYHEVIEAFDAGEDVFTTITEVQPQN